MLSPNDAICTVAPAGGVPGAGVASPADVAVAADGAAALDAALDAALVSVADDFDPPHAAAPAATAAAAAIIDNRWTRIEVRRFCFMTRSSARSHAAHAVARERRSHSHPAIPVPREPASAKFDWRSHDLIGYTGHHPPAPRPTQSAGNLVSTRKSPQPSATQPAHATATAVTSIRRLVRVLRLAAQRTHATAGISAAQLFVLQQLRADETLSLNDIAARTLTDRSSVADVVDRLRAQGLVDRTTDALDRRRAAVRITARGRRMLARTPEAPTTVLIAALNKLAPRDRVALARSLVRLNQALGAADEPATMLFAESDSALLSKKPARRRSQ
jgi:DNA-binding MarR family transcriptional regulator